MASATEPEKEKRSKPVHYGDLPGRRTRNRPHASRFHPWKESNKLEEKYKPAVLLLPPPPPPSPKGPAEELVAVVRFRKHTAEATSESAKTWPDWNCAECGTSTTTQRRAGPDSSGQLCNVCGTRYYRAMKRRGEALLGKSVADGRACLYRVKWVTPKSVN